MRLKQVEVQKVFLGSNDQCDRKHTSIRVNCCWWDLNGHVGTNVDGYDGVHGRYGFGERNTDGERILEFCDAMELIVTNTCFKRQKSKLATYVSGDTASATDYLLLQRCDR